MNRNMPDNMYILDLAVHKYETFVKVFALESGSGSIITLFDGSAKAEIRETPESTSLIAAFLCTVNAAAGTITLELPSSVTRTLTPGEYCYDVALTMFDERRSVERRQYLVGGKFTVLPSVTH